MKNCENELSCSPILVIFEGPPYFDLRYLFVKTDFGLSCIAMEKQIFQLYGSDAAQPA